MGISYDLYYEFYEKWDEGCKLQKKNRKTLSILLKKYVISKYSKNA
jgi:hypothetical protein